jgi:hypothetical protein
MIEVAISSMKKNNQSAVAAMFTCNSSCDDD